MTSVTCSTQGSDGPCHAISGTGPGRCQTARTGPIAWLGDRRRSRLSLREQLRRSKPIGSAPARRLLYRNGARHTRSGARISHGAPPRGSHGFARPGTPDARASSGRQAARPLLSNRDPAASPLRRCGANPPSQDHPCARQAGTVPQEHHSRIDAAQARPVSHAMTRARPDQLQ
jgi:hypothetical protein